MALDKFPIRLRSISETIELIDWFRFFAMDLRPSQNIFSIEILVKCPEILTERFLSSMALYSLLSGVFSSVDWK